MIRGLHPLLRFRLAPVFFISIALMLLSGCGSSDDEMKQTIPQQSQEHNDPPIVVEWHPSPAIQQSQLVFNPAPVTGVNQPVNPQWAQSQPTGQGNPYPAVTVPQGWMLVPVPVAGNGGQASSGYTGQYSGAESTGTWQQSVPVWNTPTPQVPTYAPQQGAQQYPYSNAPQGVYTQRPWGEAAESTNNGTQVIDSWQRANQLPAWGEPGYSGAPVPNSGYYSPYQVPVMPGYAW
jgi:hypothetical protein